MYHNMSETENILLENVREFSKKAAEAKNDRAYNSAVTLYFKAIAVLIDLYLFKNEGSIPSNHAERFRILESKYPLLYSVLDKNFSVYQQSYRLKLNKKYVEVLENDFRKILKFTGIELN